VPLPARNTLAVIGAGPIGLEAAARALDLGLDVHVFERGEVGAHPIAWGHVGMFTPWRMNLGPASSARLQASGWVPPGLEGLPTGAELAERYLEPLAGLPELKPRVHTHAQVVHVGRLAGLKGDSARDPARRQRPFRLLVRDAGGRENFVHAFRVIDASGVYGRPNWAGDGGIPARQELHLAPQLSYHLEDVLGGRRDRYAGKRTLVVGAGASAATTAVALARLADETPGTTALWVTRRSAERLFPPNSDEPLPARAALYVAARALAEGRHSAIVHLGGTRIEGMGFNSATHRYRITLTVGEQPRLEEVDQVIVNTGYRPDSSLHDELQVHESYSTSGPMKLAAAIEGARDCLAVPACGAEALANPEPDFWILGHKSYGRNPHFLLQTGYRQVADVMEAIAGDAGIANTSGAAAPEART